MPRKFASVPYYHLAAIPPHLCRGKPRQKCSGRPGHSRPGCWRCVYPPVSGVRRSSRKYTQRRWGSTRLRLERCTFDPASEPFRLRPRRPSVHPSRLSLPLFQGAQGLPSTALQSPLPPHLPDRLQGHAPLRSAPHGTARLTTAAPGHPTNPRGCETGQHHRLTSSLKPQPQCVIDHPTTLGGPQKGYKNVPGKQRLPPLRVLMI